APELGDDCFERHLRRVPRERELRVRRREQKAPAADLAELQRDGLDVLFRGHFWVAPSRSILPAGSDTAPANGRIDTVERRASTLLSPRQHREILPDRAQVAHRPAMPFGRGMQGAFRSVHRLWQSARPWLWTCSGRRSTRNLRPTPAPTRRKRATSPSSAPSSAPIPRTPICARSPKGT